MRSSFDVISSTRTYPVHIGAGLMDEAMAAPGERLFLVDAFLADRFRAAGLDPLVVEADEHAKSLERMTEVVVALRERRATRATHLVAVGGGAVQDVAAFAASIYMRGIAWTYVPTTLLAMADSCIGGKSSVNVGRYKNIVGTFYPPAAVLIDPQLTDTLSCAQRAAGLIEAAKICLCRGLDSFDRYLALAPSAAAKADAVGILCDHSLRAKRWFIEIDEFDRDERLLLNFGHTFGHAIEAASEFAIGHGICVGLGMLAALRLGESMGRDYWNMPHIVRFEAHIDELLRAAPGSSKALAALSMPRLMDAFGSDKKHDRNRFAVIMVSDAGAVQRDFLTRDVRSAEMVEQAYGSMIAQRVALPATAARSDGLACRADAPYGTPLGFAGAR